MTPSLSPSVARSVASSTTIGAACAAVLASAVIVGAVQAATSLAPEPQNAVSAPPASESSDAAPAADASGAEAASTARAAEAPAPRTLPPPPRPSEGVRFRFTPDVWFPRLNGHASFGGGTNFDFADDLDLDDSEATFDGEALVRWDIWDLRVSGFAFSTDGTAELQSQSTFDGIVAMAGDRVRSEFDLSSVAAEFSVALFRPFSDQVWPWSAPRRNESNVAEGGHYRADLRISPLAGVRWLGIDHSLQLESNGARARFDGDWFALYGGLRLELEIRIPEAVPFLDRMVVSVGGAYGGIVGGGSGTMWQIRAGLDLFITPNIAVSGGYQLLEIDGDEGGYDLDGSLQGLFIGATIAF